MRRAAPVHPIKQHVLSVSGNFSLLTGAFDGPAAAAGLLRQHIAALQLRRLSPLAQRSLVIGERLLRPGDSGCAATGSIVLYLAHPAATGGRRVVLGAAEVGTDGVEVAMREAMRVACAEGARLSGRSRDEWRRRMQPADGRARASWRVAERYAESEGEVLALWAQWAAQGTAMHAAAAGVCVAAANSLVALHTPSPRR
jgi:hypothetical protein